MFKQLDAPLRTFLLTARTDAQAIAAQHAALDASKLARFMAAVHAAATGPG